MTKDDEGISIHEVFNLTSSGIRIEPRIRADINLENINHRHELMDRVAASMDQSLTNQVLIAMQKATEFKVENLKRQQEQLYSGLNNFNFNEIVSQIQMSTSFQLNALHVSTSSQLNALQNQFVQLHEDALSRVVTAEDKIKNVEIVTAATVLEVDKNRDRIGKLEHSIQQLIEPKIGAKRRMSYDNDNVAAPSVSASVSASASASASVSASASGGGGSTGQPQPKKHCKFCDKPLSKGYLKRHEKSFCFLNPGSVRYYTPPESELLGLPSVHSVFEFDSESENQ